MEVKYRRMAVHFRMICFLVSRRPNARLGFPEIADVIGVIRATIELCHICRSIVVGRMQLCTLFDKATVADGGDVACAPSFRGGQPMLT